MHVIMHTRNQNRLTALEDLEVSVGYKVKMLKSLKWRSENALEIASLTLRSQLAVLGLFYKTRSISLDASRMNSRKI
jgi:hypothetical protein